MKVRYRPPYLSPGDTVGFLCTARSASKEELLPAAKLLEDWGLKSVYGETIGKVNHQMGGTDQEKISDFQRFLSDPKIKCIWIARGGYGTARIIDKIDFSDLEKNPKWIVGFSDITVLHAHLQENLGLESIHALMPSFLNQYSKSAIESVRRSLFGDLDVYRIAKSEFNKLGQGRGVLCGGNLSLIYSLQATPTALNTKGKILFLEELDEYLYHIDRMMGNLKRSGLLSQLAGLVIGDFIKMRDNETPFGKNAKEIIRDHLKDYSYPICYDFPSGHTKNNHSLYFGREVALEVSKNAALLHF